MIPTIQTSVPSLVSSLLALEGGGARRPYCRVEEKVNQTSCCCSVSLSMNGDHFGNELVSAVVAPSATPPLLALSSAIGALPPLEIDVRNMVAVASVSPSQDLSGAAPAAAVTVQVDSS